MKTHVSSVRITYNLERKPIEVLLQVLQALKNGDYTLIIDGGKYSIRTTSMEILVDTVAERAVLEYHLVAYNLIRENLRRVAKVLLHNSGSMTVEVTLERAVMIMHGEEKIEATPIGGE